MDVLKIFVDQGRGVGEGVRDAYWWLSLPFCCPR